MQISKVYTGTYNRKVRDAGTQTEEQKKEPMDDKLFNEALNYYENQMQTDLLRQIEGMLEATEAPPSAKPGIRVIYTLSTKQQKNSMFKKDESRV